MGQIMTTPNLFEVLNMHPEDIDSCYNCYRENNSFVDKDLAACGFTDKILSNDHHYNDNDFVNILQHKKTRGIVLVETTPFQEYDEYSGSYREDCYYINIFRGFLVYEKVDSQRIFNILFIEADKQNLDMYRKLLQFLQNKLKEDEFCKINVEVDENRYDLLKSFSDNKFKQQEMVRSRKGLDTFIFSYETQ